VIEGGHGHQHHCEKGGFICDFYYQKKKKGTRPWEIIDAGVDFVIYFNSEPTAGRRVGDQAFIKEFIEKTRSKKTTGAAEFEKTRPRRDFYKTSSVWYKKEPSGGSGGKV